MPPYGSQYKWYVVKRYVISGVVGESGVWEKENIQPHKDLRKAAKRLPFFWGGGARKEEYRNPNQHKPGQAPPPRRDRHPTPKHRPHHVVCCPCPGLWSGLGLSHVQVPAFSGGDTDWGERRMRIRSTFHPSFFPGGLVCAVVSIVGVCVEAKFRSG